MTDPPTDGRTDRHEIWNSYLDNFQCYVTYFQTAKCEGGDSCCTPDNPCGEGEGDCDR